MGTTNQVTSVHSHYAKMQHLLIRGDYDRNINKNDLVGFIRNLTTLVSNGVSIAQALETLMSDSTFRKYRKLIRGMLDTVKTGGSLSSGLEKFPGSFPSLLVHQVRVSEKSGTLHETLSRIVDQLESASRIKSFIIKKTTYPAILLLAGTGSVAFMLTNVIPAFQKMYEESGATLPGITEFVIGLSGMLERYGSLILGVMCALASGVVAAFRNTESRIWIDRSMLQVPLLGNWMRGLGILQFTETLGHLLASGFNLADALPAAAKAVNNRYMQTRLLGLHSAIRRGEKFSVAMHREADLFPPVVKQLVVVGERTGRLTEITLEIHEHLKSELEKKTAAMLGSLEPILTSVLAIIIGGILLSVYLPMFDMIGSTRSN